jgi:hypothetical protein
VVALETVRLTATLVLPPSPQKVTLQLYDPGVRLVGLSVAVAANGVLPPLTLSHRAAGAWCCGDYDSHAGVRAAYRDALAGGRSPANR